MKAFACFALAAAFLFSQATFGAERLVWQVRWVQTHGKRETVIWKATDSHLWRGVGKNFRGVKISKQSLSSLKARVTKLSTQAKKIKRPVKCLAFAEFASKSGTTIFCDSVLRQHPDAEKTLTELRQLH